MTTTERKLAVPDGYDAAANPRVTSFAAQLDDQLRRLQEAVADLEVAHLEWQPRPGVNTIGMLLAHLAVAEVWWMRIASRELPEPEWEPTMVEITGIRMDDDGLPLPPEGGHPATLRAKTLVSYLEMLSRTRAATHEELRRWTDGGLSDSYRLRDRVITREWTVYHALEHLAAHFGQILLLKHLMRDAGVLGPAGTTA